MNNYETLQNVATKINELQNENLTLHEDAKKAERINKILIIIVLIGGFFSNATLMGFIAFTGIFDNATAILTLGIVFVFASYLLNKKIDSILVKTFLTTTFLSGITLIITSLVVFELAFLSILFIVLGLSISAFLLFNDFIIRLLSVISCLFTISLILLELGLFYFIQIYFSVLLLGLFFILKNESKWFTNKIIAEYYKSFVVGLQILLLLTYSNFEETINNDFTSELNLESIIQYLYILNFTLLSIFTLYLVYDVLKNIIKLPTNKMFYILIPILIIIAGSYFNTNILFSLCSIFIAFKFKEKLFFAGSILAFIYSLGMFYYNLSISLLHKSELLMGSGIVFLILFFIIHKLNKNEKNNNAIHIN